MFGQYIEFCATKLGTAESDAGATITQLTGGSGLAGSEAKKNAFVLLMKGASVIFLRHYCPVVPQTVLGCLKYSHDVP